MNYLIPTIMLLAMLYILAVIYKQGNDTVKEYILKGCLVLIGFIFGLIILL
jgi:hypothetical protein